MAKEKQRGKQKRGELPQIRQKRKRGGNPNPLPPPVEHRFKRGQSGNPGGRPKGVSAAYTEWLAMVNENDPLGRTNAQLGAIATGVAWLKGNIAAGREIRSATEGERIRTWRDDVVEWLRNGEVTAQQVKEDFGDDADELLRAAGILRGAQSMEGAAVEGEATGDADAQIVDAYPEQSARESLS